MDTVLVCRLLEYNDRVVLTYSLLKNKIPSPPTKSITDQEFDDIQREIENDVIEPDHPCPTPSNSFNCREAPVCIHRDQSGNLLQMKYENQGLLEQESFH